MNASHLFKKICKNLLPYSILSIYFLAQADTVYKKTSSFYDKLPKTPKGGTLRIMSPHSVTDPKSLNPILNTDANSGQYDEYLWMSLMTLDTENLNELPALATSYSISEDKKTYTFYLNPKAKWQDDTPVTSEDFRLTFDLIQNPKVAAAVLRSYYHGISMETPNKNTVVFKVDSPRFDTLFQMCAFAPVQKKQFEQTKDFNQDAGIMNPIGNGPYIFSRLERGSRLIFNRNKTWWGNELSHYKNRYNMDTLEFPILSDYNLTYEKFLSQQVDTLEFTSDQWHNKVQGIDKDKFAFEPNSKKSVWGLKIENKSPKVYSYIGWNEKNPIFADKNTRRALSYLIDYNKILEKVYYNLSIQSSSPFGSLTNNSDVTLRKTKIVMNRGKAMELLRSSGWKNTGGKSLVKIVKGKKIPFEFKFSIVSSSQTALKIAQIIKEDFKKSGIIMNIQSLEWNTFLDQIEKHDFDAVTLAWTSTLYPNARQIWHSKSQGLGGSNFIGYSNPKVDDLIDKSNMEFDIKKRNLMMQEINRLIYEDQPYTFLFEPKYSLEGLNSKIQSHKWSLPYDNGVNMNLFYLP